MALKKSETKSSKPLKDKQKSKESSHLLLLQQIISLKRLSDSAYLAKWLLKWNPPNDNLKLLDRSVQPITEHIFTEHLGAYAARKIKPVEKFNYLKNMGTRPLSPS